MRIRRSSIHDPVQVKTSITARLEREARDRRDIEIIELNAGSLNREAMDTFEYQRLSSVVRKARIRQLTSMPEFDAILSISTACWPIPSRFTGRAGPRC